MVNTQNMNWKRFFTLFSIFLIVLAGAVSIFLYKRDYIYSKVSRASDLWISFIKDNIYKDTANTKKDEITPLNENIPLDKWNNYTNDRYNYTIKYRPDFQIRELEDKALVSIDNVKEDLLPTEKDYFVMFIKINSNDSSLSAKKYLELYARANENCRSKILNSFSEYRNNNIQGIAGNADPCSETPDFTVIFTDDNYAYIIDLKTNQAFKPFYTDDKMRIFSKTLSTFEIHQD